MVNAMFFTAIHQYYKYLSDKETMGFIINFNLFCVLLLVGKSTEYS